jgi:hypothetical protein
MKDFEIDCDNCGSHNVNEVPAPPPEPPRKETIKMSEAVERIGQNSPLSWTSTTAMTYTAYRYRCNNCGEESKAFTRPS